MRDRWLVRNCFDFFGKKSKDEPSFILRAISPGEYTRRTDFDELTNFSDVSFYTRFFFQLLTEAISKSNYKI